MAKDTRGRELPKGIRQRKNGTYEGRVAYEGKRYNLYGDTVTEVKKKMTDLKYKLEHGLHGEASKMTLDQWFSIWMNQYKKNNVKIGTVLSYESYYKYYIQASLGKKKIVSIRGEHIQKLYNDLCNQGMEISSIKIASAILNGCMKQALKNGLIEKNPVSAATLPKEKEKKQRRVLTMEEQRIFMEYARKRKSFLYYFFELALRTGMRNGELRGLKLVDIDKKNNVIHVNRTLKYETRMGFFEDTPKTSSSKRDIPLTEEIMRIIEEQKYFWGKTNVFDRERYLFCDEDGGPISRERVQREIGRIIKNINDDGIGFEHFTPHCFRHTFATRAIEAGMQPQTLKSILGHTTLSMTMDLYSHVLPTTKAREMELIEDVFSAS